MTIAIIGYGSLIWDLDDLEPHVTGPWQRGAGPRLPVEFSRISAKRRQALVLVVDEAAEAPSPTSVIASVRPRLDEAVADLARRERCQPHHLGIATRHGGRGMSRFSGVLATAEAWLTASPYEAAIWTELDGNFETVTGRAFSLSAAETYLRTLDGASLAEAWRYIEEAPAETDTPLRRHIRAQDWWRALESSAGDEEAQGHAPEPA